MTQTLHAVAIKMNNKRKAAEYFQDIDVESEGRQPSKASSAPRLSKAELLKETLKKQLMAAVVGDTSKTSRASEYQSQSYAQWTRSDAVEAAHSYRFEEKYANFISGDKKSGKISAYSSNSSSSYFDKQERRHDDAIFSSSRRNEMPASDSYSDDGSSDDDGSYRKNKSKRTYEEGERVPITSFSKEDKKAPSFVPQTKLAQKELEKATTKSKEMNDAGSDEDESLPLYKTIKKGDRVMAKYFVNGQYYPALVKTVTHSGFINAHYDVVFDFHKSVQTVGWSDISEIINNSSTTSSASSSNSSSSGTGAPAAAAPPPPPPAAPVLTKVVDVAELAKPQTTLYNTVAGVPIKTIRYDSATGKAIINEEPGISATTSVSNANSLLASNPVLAGKISDIVNRINSGVSGGGSSSSSSSSSSNTSSISSVVPTATVPTSAVANASNTVSNSGTSYSGVSSTSGSAAGTGGLLPAAAISLVNPKLAARAKGSWKLAKCEKAVE